MIAVDESVRSALLSGLPHNFTFAIDISTQGQILFYWLHTAGPQEITKLLISGKKIGLVFFIY